MASLPILVVPIDLGTIISGNARSNRGVGNLNRLKYPGMTWKSDGNSNVWARGSLAEVTAIDFCAIIAATAQAGTTYRLRLGTTQAEVDGESAPYDSGALTLVDPARPRDDGLYHSHLELAEVENASWWRIDIAGHTGDFEAAGLVLGQRQSTARYYDQDFEYGHEDLGSLDIARNGVVAETPGAVLRTLLFRLAWLSEAEYFTMFEPVLRRYGKRAVIYWCLDPESGPYRQHKTYLGYFERSPFARGNQRPREFTMEVLIRSLF